MPQSILFYTFNNKLSSHRTSFAMGKAFKVRHSFVKVAIHFGMNILVPKNQVLTDWFL